MRVQKKERERARERGMRRRLKREEGESCAAIYGHTTDSASLLAVGLVQLPVNKMAFLPAAVLTLIILVLH